MSWFSNFLEKLFPVKGRFGSTDAVIIDIPAELYYKELAVYTASSLIGNAISRSEIKVFQNGEPVKRSEDYYLLNVSPNRNETSSVFWHKVINKTIREGKALVVEVANALYCADSFAVEREQPILGDIYSSVVIGNMVLDKKFNPDNSYLFCLDDMNVKTIIDGMYDEYGKIMSAAAKAFKYTNGRKYKIHIDGVKSGDEEFEKEFEEIVSEQLKNYISSENAVYPEFDGYSLEADKGVTPRSSEDFIKLKENLFNTVAAAFHIPQSMMTGNITNMDEIVGAFLSFGVDPYADMITEVLNKRGGVENYIRGNMYTVDTSKIHHRDLFNVAVGVSNLISSGTMCIDEVREELRMAPLNTEWSRKHFITKNFEEIVKFLKGGEE